MASAPWRNNQQMVACLKAILRLVTDYSSVHGHTSSMALHALTTMGTAALPTTEFIDDYLVGMVNRVTLAGVAEEVVISVLMPRRWKDARGAVRLGRAVKHAFEAYLLAGEPVAAYQFVANATAAVVDSGHALRPDHPPAARRRARR
jgi:hypothetical protein